MNHQIELAELTYVGKNGVTHTYGSMVAALFKPMEGVGAKMMHAAIGIAGESGELRNALGRKNVLEECGDLEFYIEAAWQELPARLKAQSERYAYRDTIAVYGLGGYLDAIHTHGAEALDHAKKVWVYGGAKGDRNVQIAKELDMLEHAMEQFYEVIGVTRAEVQLANMRKLLGSAETVGRYESGQYSDQQALARADKEPGAGRSFMSDAKKS